MEKMNDYENQVALIQRVQASTLRNHVIHESDRVTLSGIPILSTREVLRRQNSKEGAILDSIKVRKWKGSTEDEKVLTSKDDEQQALLSGVPQVGEKTVFVWNDELELDYLKNKVSYCCYYFLTDTCCVLSQNNHYLL